MMNPYRRRNPSSGGELAALAVGGDENWWDGTLAPINSVTGVDCGSRRLVPRRVGAIAWFGSGARGWTG
jgi:hypothetical protein